MVMAFRISTIFLLAFFSDITLRDTTPPDIAEKIYDSPSNNVWGSTITSIIPNIMNGLSAPANADVFARFPKIVPQTDAFQTSKKIPPSPIKNAMINANPKTTKLCMKSAPNSPELNVPAPPTDEYSTPIWLWNKAFVAKEGNITLNKLKPIITPKKMSK